MEESELEEEKFEVEALEYELMGLRAGVLTAKAALKDAEVHLANVQQAQDILQRLAQAVQQQAHERIAAVVSSCLVGVFGEEAYEFKIEFERKRGKTEAQLFFVRDGVRLDPLASSGGGVVDVAAFALRIACLVLHRPRLNRVVVLDEPFKYVSEEYQENVRAMVERLAKDLEIQIIFITHNENLATGQIIHI